MLQSSRERSGRARAAGLALGLLAAAVPLLAGRMANADTPTNHTVRASTGTIVNAAPGSVLTGLTDGQNIAIRVTQAGPTDPIYAINQVRECKGGANIANQADMGPSYTGLCSDGPLSDGTNYKVGPAFKANPTDNFIDINFKVGVGSKNVYYDDGEPHYDNFVTCDATHSCSLWIEIARNAGSDFVHYDLDFLGQPGSPTAVAATCTDGGANVSWAAPANTGHGTIDQYTVTATPTGAGAAVAPVNVSGTTLNTAVNGLSLGESYDITVTARNIGTAIPAQNFTSAPSAPVSVTRCLNGPVLSVVRVTNGSADLSWTYSGPAGFTGFEITVTPTNPSGPAQVIAVGAASNTAHLTGLTNGTTYKATVKTVYSNTVSKASNTVTFVPVKQFLNVAGPSTNLGCTGASGPAVIGGDSTTGLPDGAPNHCTYKVGSLQGDI